MPAIIEPMIHAPAEPETRRPFRKSDVEAAFARQGGKCADCGGEGPFENDHDLARDLGGATDLENLRILCIPCHALKTAKDRKAIAKAARIRRREAGEQPVKQKIRGGGFRRDPLHWKNA